ncbi:hypothetical protein CTAYLR_004411 [Chrysophaeum taylorii]|uniref:Uncharacterized protein n=1 Tax=Chrysophaeum taylorii TaxID=2483200 RepID=A0AAD7UNE1_9STRA|nr:hypothetical protein CTAYLR_004411 [Chrysophaeum taylorii]
MSKGGGKTRFQREKEEREMKKRIAESEAASVYEEFVASFKVDESQTFLRSGQASSGKMYRMERGNESKGSGQPGRGAGRPRSNRQIDSFLEELKSRQEAGGSSTVEDPVATKGSFDDGDPETTNLYVGNLAPTITEEQLLGIFGKFGKIESVKIMWPRTDEERARKRNCGFVSFARRDDADDAKNAVHDLDIDGYRLSVGWGKAVGKRPVLPIVAASPVVTGGVQVAAPAAPVVVVVDPPVVKQPPPPTVEAPVPSNAERTLSDDDPRVEVTRPADVEQREVIDLLAEYVAKDGAPFEAVVREREERNPLFAFLRQKCSEATYYRWKVYASVVENGIRARRGGEDLEVVVPSRTTEPFLMQLDGIFWVPPPGEDAPDKEMKTKEASDEKKEATTLALAGGDRGPPNGATTKDADDDPEPKRTRRDEQFLTGRQAERARDLERVGRRSALHPDDGDTFRTLVLQLTTSRVKIAEAMAFALDHVESAADIVDILDEAMIRCEPTTSLAARVARIYLASDVLRNASVPMRGAQHYRTLLQSSLPEAFATLNAAARATTSRIAAKSFEDRVVAVLAAWLRWSLFPPLYVHGLESTFFASEALEDGCYADGKQANLDTLDVEALRRKARVSGVPDSGSRDLLVALSRARRRARTAVDKAVAQTKRDHRDEAKTTETPDPSPVANAAPAVPVPQQKKTGTWVDADAIVRRVREEDEEEEDDDEIDGEEMDMDAFNSVPDVIFDDPPRPQSPAPEEDELPAPPETRLLIESTLETEAEDRARPSSVKQESNGNNNHASSPYVVVKEEKSSRPPPPPPPPPPVEEEEINLASPYVVVKEEKSAPPPPPSVKNEHNNHTNHRRDPPRKAPSTNKNKRSDGGFIQRRRDDDEDILSRPARRRNDIDAADPPSRDFRKPARPRDSDDDDDNRRRYKRIRRSPSSSSRGSYSPPSPRQNRDRRFADSRSRSWSRPRHPPRRRRP